MKAITEWNLIDHGIDNCQFIVPNGTAFTEYTDSALGCGDNFAEALDDALESLAQVDYETEGMESQVMQEYGLKALPQTPSVSEKHGDESEDLYYYVELQVK